jgi:tetratricopeptide (TPR) repeat protein/transcriptional regulator with XRE-family HTH domain
MDDCNRLATLRMERSPQFGGLLKRYRLRAGLTQEGLAERALLSPRGIQDLERGVNRRPRKDTVERLIEALKMDADDRTALEAAARVPVLSANMRDSRTGHRTDNPVPTGGYLGAVPLSPLVERERELACCLTALTTAASGEGRSLMLAGEPGVGKTRLAQEASVRAREHGFLVAAGCCYESRQSVSYYPFLDSLGTLYVAAPSSISATIAERWPYVGRLLPDVGLSQPGALSNEHEEQERLLRAVTGFIIATSEVVPVVLLLDDLHWADEASLYLLQHVIRHTRGRRVFLLGTYRDVDVGRHHPLARALSDLHRDRLIEHVDLRRLGKDGTAALIRASLAKSSISDEFAELIHRHTDGNPFFTQEVVQALVERGDLYQENGRWTRRSLADIDVPESVRSVIAQRVFRLDEDTQEMLSEASVLGQAFTFDDLHAMNQRREAEVEHCLQEALAAGLLREADPDAYVFNHALTQQTLYTELPSRKRRRLHVAAAEALATLPSQKREKRVAELSWHFLRGGDVERALPYAMLAGREAERLFAFGEAERHYRTGLELARQLDDRGREAEALERLGVVLATLDRHDEALEMLEQSAVEYGDLGDRQAEACAVAAIGRVHASRGSENAGVARVEPVIHALEESGSTVALARLYLARASLGYFLSKGGEQFHYADRAVEVARAVDDPRLLTEAMGMRGNALLNLRRLDEAASDLEQVVPIYEELHDLAGLIRALDDLAYVHDAWGQFADARKFFERCLVLARRMADPLRISRAAGGLAWNALVRGEWDQTRKYIELMEASTSSLHSPRAVHGPRMLRIALSLREGRYEEASQHLADAEDLAESSGVACIPKESGFLRAHLDLLQGRPDAAVSILRAQVKEAEPNPDLTILPLLAEAYVQSGNLVQAEQVVLRALHQASTAGDRRTLMGALRVHGMLLTRRAHWSEAARVLDQAVALAESMQTPWEEAQIRYEFGMMHAAFGHRQPAREQIKEALAISSRLGAKKDSERTEQALASVTLEP